MSKGHPLGLHRVLEPQGSLPQAAWRVDNTMEVAGNEILLNVQTLNVDAASFSQIRNECDHDAERMAAHIMQIVADRGKLHNPVTGSGGMLIGSVAQIGDGSTSFAEDMVAVGDRVATLVSLSLTPLRIDRIKHIDVKNGQVDVEGQAILFETGLYAKLPNDLPDRVGLAALDVCGAPAQVKRLVQPGQTVVILGAGGKSGLFSMCQARRSLQGNGTIIAIDRGEAACRLIRESGWADHILDLDATNAIAVVAQVINATGGRLADLTINCVSVPGTEMSSILATMDRGTVYFFSMATSFTQAALGAEGVGKDVDLMIGNGYAKGHAELTLDLVRQEPFLKELFSKKYA